MDLKLSIKRRLQRVIVGFSLFFLLFFTLSPLGALAIEDGPQPGLDQADEREDVQPGKGNQADVPDIEFGWDEINRGEASPKPKPENSSSGKPDSTIKDVDPDLDGGSPNLDGHNPDLDGGSPNLDGHNPDLDGGLPNLDGYNPDLDAIYSDDQDDLTGSSGWYSGNDGNYNGLDGWNQGNLNNFPGMEGWYPGYPNGILGMPGWYPGNVDGSLALGGMYPPMLGGLFGSGSWLGGPGFIHGYSPYLPGGIYGPGLVELLGPDSVTKKLGDAYFGKSGTDEGGTPSKVTDSFLALAGGVNTYASFANADFGAQKYAQLLGVATLLPLDGVAPWIDSEGFKLSVDGAGYVFDVADHGFEWYEKLKKTINVSTLNKGNFLKQLPSLAKQGGAMFLSEGKQLFGSIASKIKGGSLLSDGLNSFKGANIFAKGSGVLSAVSAVSNTIEMVHDFQSGNITDGIGNGIGALGDGLMAGSLFTGPYAPIVAGAGLVLSGVSLAIRHRKIIGRGIDKAVSFTGDMLNKGYNFAGDVINGTTNIVNAGVKGTTNMIKGGIEGAGNFVANGIQGLASNIGGGMQPRIIGQGIEMYGSRVANGAANFAQDISDGVQNVSDKVTNTIDTLGKGAGNTAKVAGKVIGKGLNSLGDGISKFFGN